VTLPLRVTVAPERADAAPGDNLQFDVTVRNASDIVEHYGVEMLGLPEGSTVRTEPDVAKLRPAETGTLTVRVGLPVQPPAPAGTYVLGALVRSKYRHDVSRCVEVPVELASIEQITVTTSPEVVIGGRAGQYTVEVANGGNAPVRLYLAATDPERRVTVQFQPPVVDLPPGGRARALLSVSAPLPWSQEKQRSLTVTAHPDMPGAQPATSTASFVQRPRIASKFAKIAGIGAAVVLLAAAIAVPALLAQGKKNDPATPAAATGGAVAVPSAPAVQPPAGGASSAAVVPPAGGGASEQAQPPQQTTEAPPPQQTTNAPPPQNGPREVDLTTPPPGVVASDVFRDQGFLVSADPGAVAVPGCADARNAAVVAAQNGAKFLTSSSPDDPARCHEVPLLISFLADAPAGEVTVTPATPNTLTLDATFADLSRGTFADLKVPAQLALTKGGVRAVLLRSTVPQQPVAATKLTLAPLG
jgi:hypothetical protein